MKATPSSMSNNVFDTGTSSTYQDIMNNYGDFLIRTQLETSKIIDFLCYFQPIYACNISATVDQHNSMQASTSFGTANSISHQFPGGFDPNASFYDDGSCGLNYSQEEGMSYMDMLLGVQKSADARNYKDFQQGPLGDENKLFMITGRYSDGNDNMLEDEEPFEQFHENSMQTSDTLHEEDSSHFDNSTAQNEENSDAEWDDLAPKEYDIFGDGRKDTSVDQEPNASTDQQPIHSNDHPACASTEGNNTKSQEPVEHLSQQDIEDFLVHDNIETCSQEVRRQHTPHLDMIFDSDEQAYHFYNEYAGICGFSVKKAGTYHARKAGSTGHTRATFLCNKSGKIIDRETLEAIKKRKQERKQERTGVVPAETQKRRRANIVDITGCLAKMVVSLKNGKWVVISVDLEHNHQLSPPDETKFLRSHKHMTEQEKLFIRTFNSVKLPTRKIMAILAYLRGGVGALPYTKKYVSNVRTAIRNECKENDMTQVLEYFRKRKQADPRFFYDFKLGEGNKVLSIFWSDEYSRKMYELYGDCVSFDTTYKTNRYNLPFAPFVGVTGHGNNCLFACAFVQNETIDVFSWLFEKFRECMGNKDPKTIITDQCVSMSKAIPAVFPNIVHRFCFFHIRKKAEEKCGRSFATKKDLHADFSDILRNSLTVEEFEMLWLQMIERYDIGHLKYLKAMWENRQRFVPVYFKKEFFPFIHSTARSEGTNLVFKDNVGATYSVISFLSEYQRICEGIQEKEKEQDSITRTTSPSYYFGSEIEIQVGNIYNRQIFYKFQKQLAFTNKLHVLEVVRNEVYEVYKTRMLAEKDFRARRFVVLVNLPQEDFSCICCKFQKDGIVCSHILRVLVNLNMSELPAKYFIDRWKPKEKKTIRDKKFNVPMQLTEADHHLRFNLLSDRLIDIASDGSKSNERYLIVVEAAKKIEEMLDAMTIAKEQEELLKKQGSKTVAKHPVVIDDGYGSKLQNPDVSKAKGRPTTAKRQKTLVEEFRTKQKITCSHCGSHDHNYATCDSKHLDKSIFQKKTPRKNPSGVKTSVIKQKQSSGKSVQNKGKKKPEEQSSPMDL